MQQIRLAVRQLVEFLLQTGDIDSRFAGFDRANEGARIHRKLQKQAGEGYRAEVFLSGSRELDGIRCTVEGPTASSPTGTAAPPSTRSNRPPSPPKRSPGR